MNDLNFIIDALEGEIEINQFGSSNRDVAELISIARHQRDALEKLRDNLGECDMCFWCTCDDIQEGIIETGMDEKRIIEKTKIVMINNRHKIVTKERLTFSEIVTIALDDPVELSLISSFTVTYRDTKKGNKPYMRNGILVEDTSIPITDGMVFNVKLASEKEIK